MIIALEGIDASGKHTQATRLVEGNSHEVWPFTKPMPCETHDFPHYQTETGSLLKRVLKGDTVVAPLADVLSYYGSDNTSIQPLCSAWSPDKARIIQGLMVIDRLEWQNKLRPFKGNWNNLLVLDRYTKSGSVYGVADGLDRLWLETIQAPLIQADAHIILDITVEESMRRRPERRDYYERNSEKLEKVRQLYLAEAGSQPGVYLVDAMQPVEAITNRIVHALAANLFLRAES